MRMRRKLDAERTTAKVDYVSLNIERLLGISAGCPWQPEDSLIAIKTWKGFKGRHTETGSGAGSVAMGSDEAEGQSLSCPNRQTEALSDAVAAD